MPEVVQNIVETWAFNRNLCEAIYTVDLTKDVPVYIDFRPPAYGRYKITSARYQAFGGTASVSLFKNADTDEDGTELVSTRYCLCDERDPIMKIRHGSTINDEGTNILNFRVFSSVSAAGQASSAVTNTASRNLNPGAIHLIKILTSDTAVSFQVFLEWTEI